MEEFLGAAFGFPAALFSAALVVVVVFWLLVLCGAADHHAFNGDAHGDVFGAGSVPVSVPVSLMIGIAWFTSLTGSVLLRRSGAGGGALALLKLGVLGVALLLGWAVTRWVGRRLRRLFPDQPPPSRLDFIGLTCTIRTGSVSATFGQAEVSAADGSSALVQVRQSGAEPLRLGSTGLLYAFDDDGEFFWVAPYDPALDPRAST
ncbi:hypothetical protein N4G70_13555 [Streptomyces sp. ASQP_92]|uniref:hypothetical protein n=1 Tax=Streptomyces sp. ASQP_92 TaxID=2979116 RepID=UPI0021C072B8|nr:hypothetical protein [Streptomyces sp. ASQP_92]MCT9089889.1 hypothetical protein [Streptomyces sp. ASQP_92]